MDYLSYTDPEAKAILDKELEREENSIELIASENFVYRSILQAQGSVFTNKYAEGYPGDRYHGGCHYIDEMETLAIERAKKLFGADHANVQPHSGVNANLAVYSALLEPGDLILGMNLDHGGHLSHGSSASITGKFFDAISYGIRKEDELIDYDEVEGLALEHEPEIIVAGASAYSREIDFERFAGIADEIDAYFMVDMAHIAGLVAAGLHQNPVPAADVVTSTTTKTLRGARGGFILCDEKYAEAIDKAIFPGTQGGPILQNVFAKAVTFKIAQKEEFKKYQQDVRENARIFAGELSRNGLRIVSGGTDNHLFLVDLSPWNLTGRKAEKKLEEIDITVNKNLIPYDDKSPRVTSGIRIGTPAVTARGFKEEDIKELAGIVQLALREEKAQEKLKLEVEKLCAENPLYMNRLEK